MKTQRGYSLIETLWALFLGTIVLGALLGVVRHAQIWTGNLDLLLDRDGNVWLLPVLLSQWVSPAGNLRPDEDSGMIISLDSLGIRSDVDGSGGFPDGDTSDRHEDITLRCSNGDLRLRSGRGNFQPICPGIESMRPSRQGALIGLTLSAATARPLWLGDEPARRSIEILYALPNFRPTLFERGTP